MLNGFLFWAISSGTYTAGLGMALSRHQKPDPRRTEFLF